MACRSIVVTQMPACRTLRAVKPCLAVFSTQKCYSSDAAQVLKVETKGKMPAAKKKNKQPFPFVKSLFLGRFDLNMLTYPELSQEDLNALNERVSPVERYFCEGVDSHKIDSLGAISQDTLNKLKDLGLFGQLVPEQYGGRALNATAQARFTEAIALDPSIMLTLSAHGSLGAKSILLFGTEDQKRRYLSRLAGGDTIAAFCMSEKEAGSDAACIRMRAVLGDDGKSWVLNGQKTWVSNGGTADLFIVFARTEIEDHIGGKINPVTAFIVERNFGGITNGESYDKLGVNGLNTCEVSFKKTEVPEENILGTVGGGLQIAMEVLNSDRYKMGSAFAGLLKPLIKHATDHAINRRQFEKSLQEFGMIKEKIARVTYLTYAMESMSYLAAGVLDNYEAPDCALESAIIKVFSTENAWYCVNECLNIFGAMGLLKDYPFERILRDTRMLMLHHGTNDISRLYIALMGIQYAGEELNETVKKGRNPLMFPNFILKRMFETRHQDADNPKLTLGLDGYLHPSLQIAAQLCEYSVLRLKHGVEVALHRHGPEIMDQQMTLQKLADCAIDIYAMTAVLGRCSRSYCIGLPNAEDEIVVTMAFCNVAQRRVKQNIIDIVEGPYVNNDDFNEKIANKVFEKHGYFPAHPLERNY